MKIAVTYEAGCIFMHYGQTKQFMMFYVEEGNITKKELVNTDGRGHFYMASFLKSNQVDILICGGIGAPALEALKNENIMVYSGASGTVDEAVVALLNGKLTSKGVASCHHHEDEKAENSEEKMKVSLNKNIL